MSKLARITATAAVAAAASIASIAPASAMTFTAGPELCHVDGAAPTVTAGGFPPSADVDTTDGIGAEVYCLGYGS